MPFSADHLLHKVRLILVIGEKRAERFAISTKVSGTSKVLTMYVAWTELAFEKFLDTENQSLLRRIF